ncbi:MAG: LysM peptidoglycan-binding domain-containing protein [Rhodomicrobium sp.]|nr:LysM peptidoglycan-binding domain-containing protein [Rhodomicrobium sp.]
MFSADAVGGGGRKTETDGKSGSNGADNASAKQFEDVIESQRPAPPVVGTGLTDGIVSQAFGVAGDGSQDDAGRPASDGTYGKSEYTAQSGDTLESVAAAHGQTVADVLIANPGLSESSVLEEGVTVAFFDQTRLGIAREMAAANDPERRDRLVMDEILYATSQSATPDDLLPALQQDMLARRPEDADFAIAIEEQSAAATDLWRGQGRTHAVMDELNALAHQGDGEALQEIVLEILGTVANTTPTAGAIAGQLDILRQYGPDAPVFAQAVTEMETFFTTEWPEQAADEIAAVYTDEGPVAAAELLADYTSAGNTDPLTAARILNAAKPTVGQIITHLGPGGWHEWPGNPTGVDNFYIDPVMKETVFNHLSGAADNASRSGEAGAAISEMARLVNEQGFGYMSS